MSTEILEFPDVFELNVTLIEPRLKHPTIFEHFDRLAAGKAFRILNDHDPKPLYYQLIGERGNIFSWTYLENGPIWWKVEIKKLDLANGETVGEIAAKDIRKAEVFKRYGIDFCCGGKKSLQQVCNEKGLNIEQVETELNNVTTLQSPSLDFNRWDADFLADYIYNQHHKYFYREEPVITGLVEKVAEHHGQEHEELTELRKLYCQLIQELKTHFLKEERILFPFIKKLVEVSRYGDASIFSEQFSVTDPVHLMESDHKAAGELLLQMQQLTNNYTPPAEACNSYRFLFSKLKELDEDLHQHIHLENNLLFLKALALEKDLKNRSL